MKITKLISLCFGVIANIRFYPPIQRFINKQYIRIFKIDLSEFYPLASYKSLNELFTRGLRQNREFNIDDNIFISPVDGKVMQTGDVSNGRALQIKGFSYSVDRLVGERVSSNLSYANLYLSPSNYHRYHAPCDMYVESITHFKGALLPVHTKSLYKNKNLFVVNERVVLKARDSFGGILYFVAVGALNVGGIYFYIEPRIQYKSNCYKRCFTYKEPLFIKKGEEIGMFKMGSTIVLFASDVEILKSDCDIKFGFDLFKRKDF
ncbi:phosphatidylserine decarboxylase [Helicobacter sp. MIT 99-5507]|uniref:phosphatidylserine decarboxylase n=1 Tax=Helicobacter sp. MIT 99-5507 TaxID=152489 RepID=UPI000E1ECF11|nr:phosphatidylserine decarboxylase [Helicobacter sp. MIT 99-5507]RDU58529.1 phosphatidylserine decarboxylase [Helicobacter sp. MIT 99-5507]